MKQVIILALGCSVYKKNPLIRLTLNKNLIDEFELPHTLNQEEAEKLEDNNKTDILRPLAYPELGTKYKFFYQKSYSKIYEVEALNKIDLELSFINNDNNYTNGFMTKSTLIWPLFFGVIPLKIFQNYDKFIKKYNKWYESQTSFESVTDFKLNYNQSLQRNPWKNPKKSKTQLINNLFDFENLVLSCTGETKEFSYTLFKKHGFWSTNENTKGIRSIGFKKEIKHFYDKYLEYENQRNIN